MLRSKVTLFAICLLLMTSFVAAAGTINVIVERTGSGDVLPEQEVEFNVLLEQGKDVQSAILRFQADNTDFIFDGSRHLNSELETNGEFVPQLEVNNDDNEETEWSMQGVGFATQVIDSSTDLLGKMYVWTNNEGVIDFSLKTANVVINTNPFGGGNNYDTVNLIYDPVVIGSTACADGDGDTVCDTDDVCPGFDDTADADGDTVPDGCDVCSAGDDRVDTDGDGTPDACDGPDPFCGDGNTDAGEQCDDGNAVTESCAYGETSCTVCTATCTNGPGIVSGYCGDGTTNGPEQCDNGEDNGKLCLPEYGEGCEICDLNCDLQIITGQFCGDGILQGGHGEECDDGNNADGDGCSSTCTVEVNQGDLLVEWMQKRFYDFDRETVNRLGSVTHVAQDIGKYLEGTLGECNELGCDEPMLETELRVVEDAIAAYESSTSDSKVFTFLSELTRATDSHFYGISIVLF